MAMNKNKQAVGRGLWAVASTPPTYSLQPTAYSPEPSP